MKPDRFYRAAIFYSVLCLAAIAAPSVTLADSVRGIVKPIAEAELASEISARISRMPYRNGERFKAGAILFEFGCERQYAELNAVEAEQTAARRAHENNVELIVRGAIGKYELLQSEAELGRLTGQLKAQQAVVSGCVVKAPFSGRILKTHVNAFESPSAGNPLVTIINDSDFELELIVPSAWLSWLKSGHEFQFSVDETGEKYPAVVKQLGAAVDPVSQSVTLTGRFESRPERVLAGMSGTAQFKVLKVAGASHGD